MKKYHVLNIPMDVWEAIIEKSDGILGISPTALAKAYLLDGLEEARSPTRVKPVAANVEKEKKQLKKNRRLYYTVLPLNKWGWVTKQSEIDWLIRDIFSPIPDTAELVERITCYDDTTPEGADMDPYCEAALELQDKIIAYKRSIRIKDKIVIPDEVIPLKMDENGNFLTKEGTHENDTT